MRNQKLLSSSILAMMLCVGGLAHGQAPAEPVAPAPSGGGGGGGAAARGLGVGVQQTIGGALANQVTAANVVYDWGQFRVSGLFGMAAFSSDTNNPTVTNFGLGATFYYVLHSTAASDFSLGGGINVVLTDLRNQGPNNVSRNHTDVGLSAGLQLRIFLVQNVSLNTDVGFGMSILSDNRGTLFAVTGNTVGGANVFGGLGVTYFFQ